MYLGSLITEKSAAPKKLHLGWKLAHPYKTMYKTAIERVAIYVSEVWEINSDEDELLVLPKKLLTEIDKITNEDIRNRQMLMSIY